MGRRAWFPGVFGRRRQATKGHLESAESGLTTFGDFTHEELAERAYGTGTGRLIAQEQVEHTLHELFDQIMVDEHYMRATHRWNQTPPTRWSSYPAMCWCCGCWRADQACKRHCS